MAAITVTIPTVPDNRYRTELRPSIVTVRTSKSVAPLIKSSNVTLPSLARRSTSGDRVAGENLYQHAEHYFRIMNAANEGHQPLVRCAPHQAIGGLIPPDVCFGAGCRPKDLISRGLSSPSYGGLWCK